MREVGMGWERELELELSIDRKDLGIEEEEKNKAHEMRGEEREDLEWMNEWMNEGNIEK